MISTHQRLLPYFIVTMTLLVFVWILTRQINEAPVLVVNSTTRIQPGWTAVSNSDLNFSLNVPRNWRTESNIIEANEPINTAVFNVLTQFSDADENLTVQTVAYSDEKDDNVPKIAVMVFQSERLNGINVNDLADFTAENNPLIKTITIIDRPWHIPQLHLITDNGDRTVDYICELRYAPSDNQYAYLVALCASRTTYSINRTNISTLFDSFQEIN
ncbi:MAG: hypothetical protein AAF490_24925 [Chloroflexota bacterium]